MHYQGFFVCLFYVLLSLSCSIGAKLLLVQGKRFQFFIWRNTFNKCCPKTLPEFYNNFTSFGHTVLFDFDTPGLDRDTNAAVGDKQHKGIV